MRPTDEHHHCKSCGNVCGPTEETCSRACADRRAQQQQSRRNSVNLMYALMAIVVVVFVLNFLR